MSTPSPLWVGFAPSARGIASRSVSDRSIVSVVDLYFMGAASEDAPDTHSGQHIFRRQERAPGALSDTAYNAKTPGYPQIATVCVRRMMLLDDVAVKARPLIDTEHAVNATDKGALGSRFRGTHAGERRLIERRPLRTQLVSTTD
jgi:hypothetical protein